MPNLFNKPVSSGFRNTYTSQFVPLPLEQFARTNELNQAKQDKEVAQLESTSDAAWKISGIADADNEYVAQLRSKFDDASSQLSTKDLTQRENQDLAKSLIKNISRDKDLATIMSNKAKYDEYQETKKKMIENNTYHAANDNFENSYAAYAKNGGYKSGKSIDPTIYKYEDARPVQEQYFNNLRELGADQVGKIGETFYKYGYDGISEGRIGKQAASAINSYMSTPAAQQEGRMYDLLVRQNGGKTPIQNGKPLSKQGYIFNNFLNAGMERAGMSFKSGLSEAQNTEAKTKKEEESLFSNITSVETPSTLTNGHKIEFTEDGQIFGSGRPWSEIYQKEGAWGLIKKVALNKNHDASDEEAKDAAHIIMGAKLNGVTPKEYAEQYDKTSHMKVDKPLIGKALRDNNQALFNGGAGLWSSLNVQNITTGEKGMNFKTALEKAADERGFDYVDPGKDPEGFKKLMGQLGVSIVGQANPNEFSSKPIIFTVGDNQFAADMSFGGTVNPYKNKEENAKAQDLTNLDRLNKGQQVVEKDSKGREVIYYKDIKTGQIIHKLAKDIK